MSDIPHFFESQVPPPPQSPTEKSKRKPLLIGGAAVAVVALVAGISFAFFSGINPFSDRDPDYSQAPNQSNVMDFAALGKVMHLSGAPLGSAVEADASAAGDASAILRFIGSESSILTRVGDDGDETWTVSVPHSDIDTSDVEPIDEAPDAQYDAADSESEDASTLRGTPVPCRIADSAVRCGDRSISLNDGAVTLSDTSAEADPAPASSAVPLEVDDDGALRGPADTTFDDLSFDPDAHVSMIAAPQTGDSGPWVVSDGKTLAAVDDEKVLWTEELDSSTAEVTRLGDDRVAPSWAAVGGALVIGGPDGVQGRDLSTGDRLWTVNAETEGFDVADGRLRIHHEGKVSTFDFTDSSQDDTVSADTDFPDAVSSLPAPELPDTDDIRNATVDVPPACADLAVLDDTKQTFSDGTTSTGEYG